MHAPPAYTAQFRNGRISSSLQSRYIEINFPKISPKPLYRNKTIYPPPAGFVARPPCVSLNLIGSDFKLSWGREREKRVIDTVGVLTSTGGFQNFGLLDQVKLVYPRDQQANLIILSCLLYTSPSPRDKRQSRMPSSA